MRISIHQAVTNARAAEQAAWSFYMQLASRCEDPDVRAFLEDMAAVEASHAQALLQLERQFAHGGPGLRPDADVDLVETAPGWIQLDREVAEMDMRTALAIAEEAERHAAVYYEALAEVSTGEVATFFTWLAHEEASHVDHVEDLVAESEAA